MLCGIDDIVQNIPHIQPEWWNIFKIFSVPRKQCYSTHLIRIEFWEKRKERKRKRKTPMNKGEREVLHASVSP